MNDAESTIKKWTMREQIFKLKLPDKDKGRIDWAMELSYPFNHPTPTNIVVLQPTGKDFIVLQVAMKMSPVHEKKLSEKGPAGFGLFYHRLKVIFLNKDIRYNINHKENTWIASIHVYFDGLTQQLFFDSIHKLYNAILLGNIAIEEISQMNIVKGPAIKPSKTDGDTGNIYF